MLAKAPLIVEHVIAQALVRLEDLGERGADGLAGDVLRRAWNEALQVRSEDDVRHASCPG